jgi:hypothetical protein
LEDPNLKEKYENLIAEFPSSEQCQSFYDKKKSELVSAYRAAKNSSLYERDKTLDNATDDTDKIKKNKSRI